ncbi:MAG: hypothetical protein K0S09_583 [Sphingobacteriaceae bacterium]|jgi:uncharacterized protein YjiK|nr:hypothetical protein [Sphingobacteriaceae bacterium]
MNKYLALLLATILFSSQYSCSQKQKSSEETGKQPDDASAKTVMSVPNELAEISGISFIDSNALVAIEDEEGQLYYYDVTAQKVTSKKEFGPAGDYEDVAVAGQDIYVVDSSGKLYLIKNYRTGDHKAEVINTEFNGKNNIEGLAFDAAKNRLLLAVKDKGLDDNVKDTKEIYEFSLATKKLNTTPVYSILLKDIEAYYHGDGLEESSKKFLKALGNENMNKIFRTSALTINPKTSEIYLLSSINNLIAILTPEGKIRKMMHLNGKEFSQPEGIAFSPSTGKLFVSNEGKNKSDANIVEVVYTP